MVWPRASSSSRTTIPSSSSSPLIPKALKKSTSKCSKHRCWVLYTPNCAFHHCCLALGRLTLNFNACALIHSAVPQCCPLIYGVCSLWTVFIPENKSQWSCKASWFWLCWERHWPADTKLIVPKCTATHFSSRAFLESVQNKLPQTGHVHVKSTGCGNLIFFRLLLPGRTL